MDSAHPLKDSKFVDEMHAHTIQGGQSSTSQKVNNVSVDAVRRKVDWRIVPLFGLVYAFNFLDKVSYNYSAVMGLPQDLKLQENQFSTVATVFFASYCGCEICLPYILNKLPVAKVLGVSVTLWGVATACSAAARNFRTLLVARIFLGIFEAPTIPCFILICSHWYNKSEQAPRFAFWYCGLGSGQILGGLLSFGFQQVTSSSLDSWRIMFIVLGCVTIAIGLCVLWIIPDSPASAKFLTIEEKRAIVQHVSGGQTGSETKEFKMSQLTEGLLDIQLWFLTLMVVLASISSGIIATWSATLIGSFGYRPPIAALLNMPSGAVSILSTLIVGFAVRFTSHRCLWFVATCLPGITGGALMSLMPRDNQAGLLSGIFLVNCIVPTVVIAWQLTGANVAGQTKRAFGTSLVSAAFGVGNIIGPQTFRAKDAPAYIPATIVILVTQGSAALFALLLLAYYTWANARKRATSLPESRAPNQTDREDASFLYVT